MKYKLDVKRDVDTDEPDVYILNLPKGWKFDHDAFQAEHARGFDSMSELRYDAKNHVVPCNCNSCK